ncbi:MAG: diaminopimelate epimerase [Candidatus Omnitrophota bacterium]
MKHLKITKMQGSGNDFVVVESRQSSLISRQLIIKMCDRKYGIGADGVLLLEKTNKADIRMRIFNADGSEAEMCGNGARCAALYVSHGFSTSGRKKRVTIETKAGILEAFVKGEIIKLKMTDPLDVKLGMKIHAGGKECEVDYINTGVPHAVVKVADLSRINVRAMGRAIRRHEIFGPAGTNVDFIKVTDTDHILVRTYERGVEDETLACGTGSVASAIVAVLGSGGESMDNPGASHKVSVKTKSSESLNVYFKISKKKITDVWLEGKAQIVFTGSYPI